MRKNSVSRATRPAARKVLSSSRLFMCGADGSTIRVVQQPGKRAGLPEPARHRGVAAQEVRDLGPRKPREDSVPFLKDRAHRPAISSHPARKTPAGRFQQPVIAPESSGDLAVLRRVDPIDAAMRARSLHRRSVAGFGVLDQPVSHTRTDRWPRRLQPPPTARAPPRATRGCVPPSQTGCGLPARPPTHTNRGNRSL